MKKSKFIKSTIILIIGGMITKLMSMVIKIVITRLVGVEGMGLYMLISPTFMLLIGLSQFGFPVAISKLVSENKKNNKQLVFGILPVSLVLNTLIIIILFLTSNFLATNMLKEPRTYYALISIGLVLPFISISSILRGYFFGKEKMIPHVVSNITEDIVRLVVIVIGIPLYLTKGLEFAVAFIVLSNIFSELTSILVLFFFLPKKFKLSKNDFKPNKGYLKDVLDISLPSTGSRLIGNIGHFFEPIIITFVLLKIGYSNHFILTEYGTITGFIMPLLLMPSFFTLAISNALIPTVSYAFNNNQKIYAKNKINQALFFSLLIGVPVTIIFMIFPEFLLNFIYNTSNGVTYLRVLAPIFILYYIQIPLTSSLQAMGKAKEAMNGTLVGIIIKTSVLFIFSSFKIGLWGLVVATSINILYVTIHHYRCVYRSF
ncbi:MAG: polysaccharide biosynthesis protein [Bacilli bacterium]|nr:polysaccharide biosynthesis protein [Bacilli bacterium]MDD4547556.1 polysaccharide biosynthesis protein [Bacilli bacterium]